MSRKKAYRMIKKGNKMYIRKQREMIPLWKFYVPFISVSLIMYGKYFYSMEDMIYSYVFPISKGVLLGSIFIILMLSFFILLMARRYYWRDCLDEKWNDIGFGFGLGLWLSIMPALFLSNSCFAFILWLNSLYTSPSCEQSYWIRNVEIVEKHRHRPGRYSASGYIHSFSYAELEVGNDFYPYELRYAYCNAMSGKQLLNKDSVLLHVQQRHGWLGIDIIEGMRVDLSRMKERRVLNEDVSANDSVFQESPVERLRNERMEKRLKELFEELEQKRKHDSINRENTK